MSQTHTRMDPTVGSPLKKADRTVYRLRAGAVYFVGMVADRRCWRGMHSRFGERRRAREFQSQSEAAEVMQKYDLGSDVRVVSD